MGQTVPIVRVPFSDIGQNQEATHLIMMPSKLLTIKLTRFSAILFIVGGLVFFSWTVTIDYFEYKTSTTVAIRDYPEHNVVAPSSMFCVRFDIDPSAESKIGRIFAGDYFNDRNDSWRITKLWSDVFPHKELEYRTIKYFMGNKYCVFVDVKEKFTMEEVTSPSIGNLPAFYKFIITVEPAHSPNSHKVHEKQCNPKPVYFGIVSGQSSLPNVRNRIVGHEICMRTIRNYLFYLTYTVSINDKLPSPYDTNCYDYQNQNFLSSYDCYDQCLKSKTLEWNIISGTTFIDKVKYLNSQMDIFPSAYIEGKGKLEWLIKNKTLPNQLRDSYRTVHSKWHDFKRACRKFCQRPDCRSEKVIPRIAGCFEGPDGGNKTLPEVIIILRTSNKPIIKVTWVPKQQLIDYIVYICSGISFWLGVCPLNLVNGIKKK